MSNCLIPVVKRGVTLADIFMALVCWLPFEHSSILPFASKAGGRTEFTLLFRGEKLITCIFEQGRWWSRQNPTPYGQQNLVLCLGPSKDVHILSSSTFPADFAGLSVVDSLFQVLEPQGAAAMATHGSSPLHLSQLWK